MALLWGLVQLGVRPTTPWLALYEEAISARLDGEERREARGAAAQGAEQPLQPQQEEGMGSEELVRVLGAVAEVGFQPGPRCRELLLAAAGRRLAGGQLQPHQLAGLAWAVTRLRWRVGPAWGGQFVALSEALMPQLKPADLPPVVAFLAAYQQQQQQQQAVLQPGQQQQQEQQAGLLQPKPLPGSWTRRCLESSFASLPQTSPRALPDLLLHLQALQPALLRAAAARISSTQSSSSAAHSGSSHTPGADSGAGAGTGAGAGAGAGAVDEELVELAAAWLRRYLAQCGDKLARFTAGGLARMMLAVARAGVRPEAAWLEATCGESGCVCVCVCGGGVDVHTYTHIGSSVFAIPVSSTRPGYAGRLRDVLRGHSLTAWSARPGPSHPGSTSTDAPAVPRPNHPPDLPLQPLWRPNTTCWPQMTLRTPS